MTSQGHVSTWPVQPVSWQIAVQNFTESSSRQGASVPQFGTMLLTWLAFGSHD